jgi:hypothetical protein
MAGQRPSLDRIQRWMQAVITHPEGVAPGVASDEARRHLAVPPDEVEQVVTRSRALTAEERLAIYHRAYHARLLECLREEFPVLVRALSEEVFDAFAVGYLQKYPSRSYTLNQLGANFPRYLAEIRPEPGEGEGPDEGWPDFLIDLAALEFTFNEVFDGPGVEGEPLLEAAQLLAVPLERWPDARLVPVPCLRLLALRYPVHSYYAALRRKEEAVPPGPADTFLAVTRRDYVVRHHELAPPAYEALRALADGQTVAEAVAGAAAAAGPDLDRLAGQLRDWFQAWAAAGFFRAVRSA